VFSNQIARIACATVWNQFSERDDQRGLVGGDRFGPLFGEHQRPKQIADFVLAADFEEIETYPVDTQRAGLLDEFDTHNPNNWSFRGIYADLMPARMESMDSGFWRFMHFLSVGAIVGGVLGLAFLLYEIW